MKQYLIFAGKVVLVIVVVNTVLNFLPQSTWASSIRGYIKNGFGADNSNA